MINEDVCVLYITRRMDFPVRPVVVLLGLIVNFPGMGDMFSHQSRALVLDCGIWKSLKRLILNGDEVVLIGGIS